MKATAAEQAEARVLEILDAYLADLRAGGTPDREALLARHADLAEALGASFRALDFVHGAGRSLEVPGGSSGREESAVAGRMLGDYRLLREIGRGGMAAVYEAEQVSLGRRVALKVLPFAAVLDAKQLQRFKNEAQAAAHLQHPHIVPVHAVGSDRGVHYYAMQYVEGQSLAVAIRELREGGAGEGPKTPISAHGSNRGASYIRMAAALGVQAAEALEHAHQLGIVHRDVKPGNLLVDRAGTLWVTDFGLSRSCRDVGLTMTGELLGTIRYMSPEQALAKRVPVDHRTDVYSLGATLYELFTLQPAFPGDDPSLVLRDIASRDPVPPRRLNPALPRDVETILLKAMSKDPAARYATSQEMADDLERFLGNRPIAAKRPGPLRRAAKWGRRHRVLVGAAAGMLLLAVAGLAISLALVWREKEETRRGFDRAETNLALALEALDRVYLEEAEGNPGIREGLPRDLLQRGLRFYEAFARANADSLSAAGVRGSADLVASRIYRELGQEDRREEALDRAVSTFREMSRRWPADPNARVRLGEALADQGDLAGAIRELRAAIDLKPDLAEAHTSLGVALFELGDLDGSISEYREAIRLDPRVARSHNNLGNSLKHRGDSVGASASYLEATRLEPAYPLAHYNLGIALFDEGDFDGAIREYRAALEARPGYVEARNNLGNALRAKGDHDGAVRELREALRVRPSHVKAHWNLGLAHLDMGDLDDAIRELRTAIDLEPDLPEAHYGLGLALFQKKELDGAIRAFGDALRARPGYADAHFGLGNALMAKGDPVAAIAPYREAVRLEPDMVDAHNNLGNALFATGDVDGAVASYHDALHLRPDHADAHHNLGRVFAARGETDRAIRSFRKAIRARPKYAESHVGLGSGLQAQGDREGAIASYHEAVRLDPRLLVARNSLGNALLARRDLDGAIREYREAVGLDPRLPAGHYNLGNALLDKRDYDEAIREYLEAIRLGAVDAETRCNLGHALSCRGNHREALKWLREGHEIGSKRPNWTYPSARWVEDAERRADLEGRLERVLSGAERPRGATERIAFAEILYAKSRPAESARMYAEAFADDAALAEDPATGHRYDAACSASLAAASGGADAAEWRRRALEWLRADLAALEKTPSDLEATRGLWKTDPDLASVRDRLGDLPEPEREGWREFWAAVDGARTSAPPARR